MIRLFNQYVSAKGVLLIALEAALVVLSLVAGAKLRFWYSRAEFVLYTHSQAFLLQILTVLVVVASSYDYNNLYDLNAARPRRTQLAQLIQALAACFVLLGTVYYLLPGLLVSHWVLIIALVLTAAASSATRLGLDVVWALTARERNVLILGTGNVALTVLREFERRSDLNLCVAGLVAPEQPPCSELFGQPILGCAGQLPAIVREHNISRIIVALDDLRGALPARDLVRLRLQGIEVEEGHSALAALTGRIWLQLVRPSWFVFSPGFQRSPATVLVKRIIDVAFSILGLILFLPVMALIALAIRLDSWGPVLYRQARVGLGGKVFNVLKFRSMQCCAEADNNARWAQENDPRVTRVGRLLRKYRLDELPQFINVLRGEMSFVGPRPERPVFVMQLREQIAFYDERHAIRPGVTGWAQVQYGYGGSAESAFRKLEYDLFYLNSMSIGFDIAIVFRTVRVVLFGRGW